MKKFIHWSSFVLTIIVIVGVVIYILQTLYVVRAGGDFSNLELHDAKKQLVDWIIPAVPAITVVIILYVVLGVLSGLELLRDRLDKLRWLRTCIDKMGKLPDKKLASLFPTDLLKRLLTPKQLLSRFSSDELGDLSSVVTEAINTKASNPNL